MHRTFTALLAITILVLCSAGLCSAAPQLSKPVHPCCPSHPPSGSAKAIPPCCVASNLPASAVMIEAPDAAAAVCELPSAELATAGHPEEGSFARVSHWQPPIGDRIVLFHQFLV